MLYRGSSQSCLNCGSLLSGRFCAHCGQKDERHVRSLWHFLREATEGITHADTRLWRTLRSLLTRPGLVTQDYFLGRRERYLPAVRLYLVVSIIFFLLAGLLGRNGTPIIIDASDLGADTTTQETSEQQAARLCDQIQYRGPWASSMEPRLRAGCRKSLADQGRSLISVLLHNIPRALFSSGVGREPRYHVAIDELRDWAYLGEKLGPLKGFPGVVWTGAKKKRF